MKKKEKTNLSTGIYVRVSTEEQAQEGFSIRGQTEKLKAYALLKEWDIYNIYSDEGISGKNIVERPAINRLIEDIKKGNVNNVLVFKVDRLTRSTKNLIELVDLFEEHNCVFNSLTESIDTDTPSGRMFLKIIGIFAEFERENLACRLQLGFERKVKEGYTLASNSISYGYTRKNGQKIQEIEPEEVKIVKEIFAMYLDDNMSMNKIARTLNKREVKTKQSSSEWMGITIKKILTNPTYIGKVRYSLRDKNKYFEADGHHEKILTDEIFYRVQKKIENSTRVSYKKRPKEENYFCGILVCDLCGSKFTTHSTSKSKAGEEKIYRTAYRCSKKNSYSEDICKCFEISHIKMESAFTKYIEQINDFTDAGDINIETEGKTSKEREQLKYISSCEKKLENLQNGKKRVMEQYVSGEITFEEYREMLEISNKKSEVLENEIQKLSTEMAEVKEDDSISNKDVILNLKENWEYLNNKERMIFLQKFVKKIVVAVEKEKTRSNIAIIKQVEFNR
ncbi:MAG: recombinase family protein [Oscillospiraceae bacterium]|nr:recombinase family protein [Oscillospiraceae bacterium]